MAAKDKLSDAAVRNAKADAAKPIKLTDGGGLYLLVHPNGSKYWRFDYRIHDRRGTLAFGVYPDVSLRDARDKRDEARKQIANGVDPKLTKQLEKSAQANSFELVAREWHTRQANSLTERHAARIIRDLERDVFPWIGAYPIASLEPPHVLSMLRRIEDRGARESAHRTKALCGQIFRYAVATGRAERDPCADLRGALAPVVHKRMATITDPKMVGGLMRAIAGYEGTFTIRCALQMAPYVFVRPGELRQAEWDEFDLEAAEWRIPAHKMKMKEKHIVPLSEQVVTLLRELQPATGRGEATAVVADPLHLLVGDVLPRRACDDDEDRHQQRRQDREHDPDRDLRLAVIAFAHLDYAVKEEREHVHAQNAGDVVLRSAQHVELSWEPEQEVILGRGGEHRAKVRALPSRDAAQPEDVPL